jgi:Peptidase S46
VRMAEERAKPDADRDPEFQARNWPKQEQALDALATSYNRKVDEALLGLAIERGKRMNDKERSAAIAKVSRQPVATLYATTTLGDAKVRLDLLRKATVADLRNNRDPLIALALELRPIQREAEDRHEAYVGRMALLKPRYMEALRAFRQDTFAPDANSTLRITYGTVRGYKATPDAAQYRPFTSLTEVVAKNKGAEPFDVPERLLAAAKAKRLGPYVDDKLGDVPVDFLADLHITGGNSGSATLNAKGEMVGLVFDGNYEAMGSDWVFQPSLTRSIHVDIRYVLWLLDTVDKGDHLLKEMGVEPKLD